MDFVQLRDADIDSLEELVSPWGKAVDSLETASEVAGEEVGDPVRSGEWRGEAADRALERVDTLQQQAAAGRTEADAIHSILKEAVSGLTGSQDRLKNIIRLAEENPLLRISDDGHVSASKSVLETMVGGGVGELIAVHTFAKNLNDQIEDCLQDARQVDGDLAEALRAAARADQPDNLNFNAEADGSIDVPDDGHVGRDPYMKPEHFRFYMEMAGRALGEPFADGTPEEQSAGIGEMIKTEAERAGAECKSIDGLMVCVGAPDYMYERGGTTFGDTFISSHRSWEEWESMSSHDEAELLEHEKYHRDEQWRQHGVSFGRKYLWEEIWATTGGYTNKYEYYAETEGGETGYDLVPPPGATGEEPDPQPGPPPTPPPEEPAPGEPDEPSAEPGPAPVDPGGH